MYLQCDDFAQNWRNGLVESRSVRLVDMTELSLMYDLEDYLTYVDLPLRRARDVEFKLMTSSLLEVFYLALVTVVCKRGQAINDRFFKKNKMLNFNELKSISMGVTGGKKHLLDSLYDLLLFGYRRMKTFFVDELDRLVDNKSSFLYFISIFDAIYDMILLSRGNRLDGNLHIKALLTTFLKQKSGYSIERFKNTVH